MDTKMLKKVSTVFKNGARVIQDGQAPLNVVELSYHEDEKGKPTILAWAYPNKDKYFRVTDLEEREDGWVIKANGSRYLLKPLDKTTGKNLSADMENA